MTKLVKSQDTLRKKQWESIWVSFYFRKTTLSLNKFSTDAICLASVSTFIVEKLRKSVKRVLDDALKGIETSNYELEFRTKSEESRYLLGKIILDVRVKMFGVKI